MILEIPDGISVDIGWPSDEVLRACGANILVKGPSRVVEIDGHKLCE